MSARKIMQTAHGRPRGAGNVSTPAPTAPMVGLPGIPGATRPLPPPEAWNYGISLISEAHALAVGDWIAPNGTWAERYREQLIAINNNVRKGSEALAWALYNIPALGKAAETVHAYKKLLPKIAQMVEVMQTALANTHARALEQVQREIGTGPAIDGPDWYKYTPGAWPFIIQWNTLDDALQAKAEEAGKEVKQVVKEGLDETAEQLGTSIGTAVAASAPWGPMLIAAGTIVVAGAAIIAIAKLFR